MSLPLLAIVAIGALAFFSAFKIRAYEQGVVLRLGVYRGLKGPGLRFIIPFIDELIKVDQRVITMNSLRKTSSRAITSRLR